MCVYVWARSHMSDCMHYVGIFVYMCLPVCVVMGTLVRHYVYVGDYLSSGLCVRVRL